MLEGWLHNTGVRRLCLSVVAIAVTCSLNWSCKGSASKSKPNHDGRRLVLKKQTLIIGRVEITGNLPSGWKRKTGRNPTGRGGLFESYYSKAPGLGVCALLVLKTGVCNASPCKVGDNMIGLERNKREWDKMTSEPSAVMGVDRRMNIAAVKKVSNTKHYLSCSGFYECDNNKHVPNVLKKMCLQLKLQLRPSG